MRLEDITPNQRSKRRVEIELEVDADVLSGIDDATQRMVGDNFRTPKFEHFEFED